MHFHTYIQQQHANSIITRTQGWPHQVYPVEPRETRCPSPNMDLNATSSGLGSWMKRVHFAAFTVLPLILNARDYPHFPHTSTPFSFIVPFLSALFPFCCLSSRHEFMRRGKCQEEDVPWAKMEQGQMCQQGRRVLTLGQAVLILTWGTAGHLVGCLLEGQRAPCCHQALLAFTLL